MKTNMKPKYFVVTVVNGVEVNRTERKPTKHDRTTGRFIGNHASEEWFFVPGCLAYGASPRCAAHPCPLPSEFRSSVHFVTEPHG